MSHASFHVEDVDGAVARAELGQPVAHRVRRRADGAAGGVDERQPAREQRGQRRGVRAAGAVCRRDVEPLDGDRTWSRPSKRWSTASSPWPPVTIAARAPSPTSRSASSAPRDASPTSARASTRFGVTTVASGKSRATSAPTASSCEQLRAGRRDHHRVDDERHADASARHGGDRLDHGARERASRSSRRRRRCRRTPRRAAPSRTSAGTSCTAVTPTVFWAVSATIADMP